MGREPARLQTAGQRGRVSVSPFWLGKRVSRAGPGGNTTLPVPGCVPGQCVESGCRGILGWACVGLLSLCYLVNRISEVHTRNIVKLGKPVLKFQGAADSTS